MKKFLSIPILATFIVLNLYVIVSATTPSQTAHQPEGNTQNTTFSYQGMLTTSSGAANGSYDLRFQLFTALTDGSQLGGTATINDKSVADGLFTVELDFGPVFTGQPRYLEIAVRSGSSTGSYEVLTPRQTIQPAPYAMHAAHAANPKLRYFEEFQAIATNGGSDMEFFTVGTVSYLVVANDRATANTQVYEWEGGAFSGAIDSLMNGSDSEFFAIDGDSYLAVANSDDSSTFSQIYRWDGPPNNFNVFQDIQVEQASDIEFFTIAGEHYLAVATYVPVASKLFHWEAGTFVEVQGQPFTAAVSNDFEFFTVGGNSYLALANVVIGSDYTVDSMIYRWNGSGFEEEWPIPTTGGNDFEFFTVGSEAYLAVANGYDGTTTAVNSQIYRWEGAGIGFVWHQDIATSGAGDWQFFTIGNEAYLAVANARNDVGTGWNPLDSKIYRWNGTFFVETQAFRTYTGGGMTFFTIDNLPYFAVVNRRHGSNYILDSHIYRAALDGSLVYAP